MSEGIGCADKVREFLKYNPSSSVAKIAMEIGLPNRIVERTCRRLASTGMLSRDRRFGFNLYSYARDPLPNCSPLSGEERHQRKLETRRAYRARVRAGQPVKEGRKGIGGRPPLSDEERIARRKAHYRRVTARRAEERRLARLAKLETAPAPVKAPKLTPQKARIAMSVAQTRQEAPRTAQETSEEAIARGVRVEVLPAVWEPPRRYPRPGWTPSEGRAGARLSP